MKHKGRRKTGQRRARVGRPKMPATEARNKLAFTLLRPGEFDTLTRLCRREPQRSRSSIVREALLAYFANRRETGAAR
jgi:hypothetical protein